MMGVLSLKYIDHLQRKNADDLAFYPLTTLEKALELNQILACFDNDEPAGYLWFGSARPGYDITIYQACVDYDSRRHHLGHSMVRDLLNIGRMAGSTGVRLKCASSSESNQFWQAIGFYCTNTSRGGIKRGRDLNHWRTDIQATLFTPDTVAPSTKPTDLKDYQRMKREGVEMPSRFSRGHY